LKPALRVLVLGALALGALRPLRADDRSDAREHAAKAAELLEGGDAAKARREAFEATGLDEDNAQAWAALGRAEAALDHKDKARKALERALELDPAGKRIDSAALRGQLRSLVADGAQVPVSAAQGGVMSAFSQYVKERDHEDRVVGQGSSIVSGGDRGKAEKAARRAAMASLAEAMELRISVITEASEASDSADSQVQSSTIERAQATLRDVETRSFDEFPLPGRVTVLAWMDRQRYLDLLEDEQVLRRSNGWGVAGRFGLFQLAGISGKDNNFNHFGAELSYGAWTLGAFSLSGPLIENGSLYTGVIQTNTWSQGHINGWGAEGGWDWAAPHPWHRLQLYVPLRLQVLNFSLTPEPQTGIPAPSGAPARVTLEGLRAGAGIRWWGSDLFALDFRADYGLGLNSATMPDADGSPFYNKGYPINSIKDEGPEFSASVRIGWL
jgi:hypothetical protein